MPAGRSTDGARPNPNAVIGRPGAARPSARPTLAKVVLIECVSAKVRVFGPNFSPPKFRSG